MPGSSPAHVRRNRHKALRERKIHDLREAASPADPRPAARATRRPAGVEPGRTMRYHGASHVRKVEIGGPRGFGIAFPAGMGRLKKELS